MLDVSTELNDENAHNAAVSEGEGRPPGRVSRSGIYKIALVLAVIAIGFYVLSILSIIYTRGGAG